MLITQHQRKKPDIHNNVKIHTMKFPNYPHIAKLEYTR